MKPSQAVELISTLDDSLDLLLCGIDGIEHASYDFSYAQYNKHIGPDNSVSNVFGLGEENKFFYTVASFKNNAVVRHESGTGYAYEKDGKNYFCRYLPLYTGKAIDHKQLCKKDTRYIAPKDCVNVLYSTCPQDYNFLFFDKNCTIISTDVISPQALQINKNSLLGRLDDNICNIPIASLYQNIFKYDEKTDTVKFFDGIKWRTLAWADEE
jgi:hypothetical protein